MGKRNYRNADGEVPYWKAGPFKVRLPFVHYRFEIPDFVQGLLMCSVCLSATSLLTENLGMSFDVALAIVVLNGFFYLFHTLLGDPVVPGWITPAIPLLTAYCLQFEEGAERMQALIAFEITLGVLAIFLGVTHLAGKLVKLIPPAIKSGIILGAGISAVYSIFNDESKWQAAPITTTICLIVAIFFLYSKMFQKLANKYKIFKLISNLGILPCIIVAVILGPLTGETSVPVFDSLISRPAFRELWSEWTAFGAIGWPSAKMFITSIPTVLSIYVVLFGDVVQSRALVKDADLARDDEVIDYDPNRAHLIFGIRNTVMGVIGPDITMCGPLWAAMQVVISDRYKKGRKSMDSLIGGAASFRFGTFCGYWIGPIVSLVQPILGVAMSLTLAVQGFVSVRIGVQQARSYTDLGIAGLVAGVIVVEGAAWGLAVGIIACLVIYGKDFFRGDRDFGHLFSPEVEATLGEDDLDDKK